MQLLHCPVRLLLVLTATPVEQDIMKRQRLSRAKKKSQAARDDDDSSHRMEAPNSNLGLQREHGGWNGWDQQKRTKTKEAHIKLANT